ncbi:MAG TPA: BCAM0308 family protein [Blastocatellia bacterium]|nr:BCAM0308 family protein [Blastocatellia bacterium]
MRGKKRYSNVTFSKRVDHDAGRHRTARAPSEPEVCKECGAVYVKRRWVSAAAAQKARTPVRWRPPKESVCPGCKRREEGVPSGFVYLDGTFLAAHRDEIEHFVRKEAERAREDNPLAQVMGQEMGKDGVLTVTTTAEHLAERLGRALQQAFGGTARYDFSHENKLARVYWHRDVGDES